MLPIFVKGNLRFSLDPDSSGPDVSGPKPLELSFQNQNVSTWGSTGLPWGKLNPELHFGRAVRVEVDILSPPAPEPLRLGTTALITRETTRLGQHMGLRFDLRPEDSRKLAEIIRAKGFFPTEYLRKYPRIPSLPMIQTFPLRALILPNGAGEVPITVDVENLSPNGVLLSSENQQTLTIQPGALLNLVLEPRGWFPMPISAQGLVCRVSDELSRRTGNLIRSIGIKFTRIDETNRAAFVDLLKDILERFKNFEQPPQDS